jgi:hypothetical protein
MSLTCVRAHVRLLMMCVYARIYTCARRQGLQPYYDDSEPADAGTWPAGYLH